MELLQAAQTGSAALLGTALALGVRHGIDWDHIAAIADITSTTTGIEATELSAGGGAAALPHRRFSFGTMELRALFLASMYALGHAAVVAVLGVAALYFQAILPEWVDPLMQRVVGATLVVLGVWVFYSLYAYWKGDADFQLRSRWMIVFAVVRHGWHWLQHRVGGHGHPHSHVKVDQYGPRTAFGVGMIHGIGAETGSQVLIIAAVGGAASQGHGPAMMIAFILGLLLSNTALAFLSATGFISSSRAKALYVAIGALAGVFSLVVGVYFLAGMGDLLPDLRVYFSFGGGGVD